MRPCYAGGVILSVITSLLLIPTVSTRSAQAQGGGRVELAVDTSNFNQDGLLVLFGGLRLQGDIGLPVAAGDINGDGRADIVFCGMYGSSGNRANNGVVNFYISDGSDSGFVDTALNPPNLFKLSGQRRGDLLGTSVSANGDINGDGMRDVAVAAALNDGPNGDRFNAGAAYVVLGSHDFHLDADLSTVDGNPPPGVIAVYGPQINGRMGIWIDEGDVDGDGFADVAIGSDQMNSDAGQHVGGAYIVFGGPSLPAVIDLASPPPGVRTAKIVGQREEEHWGAALHIGDIDDDGIEDVVIGGSIFRDSASYVAASPADVPPGFPLVGHDARGASFGGQRIGCGEVYVIYGQQNWPDVIDLRTPPASATHVIGAMFGDLLGSQLHSADLNGDGRTDLIMGALQATAPDNRGNTGAVYVVYGSSAVEGATIDLADPDASGLQISAIYGEYQADCAGDSVRSYDINRDGMSELFIGSPEHTFELNGEEREDAGDTKIIFGQRDFLPKVVKLYALPAGLRVFRLAGAHGEEQGVDGGDEFSYRLAGGDVDGDGFVDYVSNAMHGDGMSNRVLNGGNVYIFSGKKLSARLGLLPPDQPPAPLLSSAVLLSAQGQQVQQADAGSSGLRVTVNGSGFRVDTEIRINGQAVVSHVPGEAQLATTQRIVNLDENLGIRNSVGQLAVRARNTQPSLSELSNEVVAGALVGPDISSIKAKRKSSGQLVLKIHGTNFPGSAQVEVLFSGVPLALKSVSITPSDFIQVKIKPSVAPAAGAVVHVQVATTAGIESNDFALTIP